jgi:hypothetical protein
MFWGEVSDGRNTPEKKALVWILSKARKIAYMENGKKR